MRFFNDVWRWEPGSSSGSQQRTDPSDFQPSTGYVTAKLALIRGWILLISLLEPLESTPPPFPSIPYLHDPTFVDRGDILDQIGRQCSEPASRVAIVGLGGVGYVFKSK